jgi:hypothetical protein
MQLICIQDAPGQHQTLLDVVITVEDVRGRQSESEVHSIHITSIQSVPLAVHFVCFNAQLSSLEALFRHPLPGSVPLSISI